MKPLTVSDPRAINKATPRERTDTLKGGGVTSDEHCFV